METELLKKTVIGCGNFCVVYSLEIEVSKSDCDSCSNQWLKFEGTFKEIRLNYHNVPLKVKATKALLSVCTIRILCTTFMLTWVSTVLKDFAGGGGGLLFNPSFPKVSVKSELF